MQRHFENEIEDLKTTIIKMASLVDEQVENSFKYMESAEADLYKFVKNKDVEVDAYDNLIMAQCENILALYQPVASDLRFILTAIKIDSQLERCGDIAVNIIQRVRKIDGFGNLLQELKVLDMGKTAREMVRDAITSFVNRDTQLAAEVISKDDIVDKFNKTIFKSLVEKMQSDSQYIKACSHLIVLGRQFERLADHATNIAEDVVFLVEAEIISHRKKLKDFQLPE